MNVAIIGSCQSRDIFNTKFIKEYKKYFNVSSYFTMTSMLSVMGKSVKYSFGKLTKTEFKDWLIEHWFQEFEKNALKTLQSKQPDVLLMDFYADARYGAISYDGSFIVNRIGRLLDKGIINCDKIGGEYSYNSNTEEFKELWKKAFDEFMRFMKNELPNTTIIINTVKGTKVVTEEDGSTYFSPNVEELEVEEINALWKFFDEYAINTYGVKAICYDREYTLDPNYPFSGLGYALVHFHKEYYRDCFEKIKLLTEDISCLEKKEVNMNLVIDSQYMAKFRNWTNKKGKFEIKVYDKYRAITAIDCREQLGEYRPQMWSKPIEVLGSDEVEYTLSFYVNIADIKLLNEDEVIFGVRTFKHVKDAKMKDAVEEYALTIQDHEICSGKDYRYIFTFTSSAQYVRLAPFMFKYIPGIEYSRIKLERARRASEYSV